MALREECLASGRVPTKQECVTAFWDVMTSEIIRLHRDGLLPAEVYSEPVELLAA